MTEPKEVINLKDDVFIHFLYSDPDDEDKRFFFKVVIEDLLHLSCEGMQIVSPQLIPDRDHQKFMTVDIRVKLKGGTIVSIEMQQSAFSMSHYKRFATYNAKMLAEQIDRGQEYQEIKPVIQVIFINDIDSDNLVLDDYYEMKNERGLSEKSSLQHRYFIQYPYIEEILKTKDIKELSNLEMNAYLFDKGLTDDILKLEKESEAVERMNRIINNFNQNKEELLSLFNYDLYHACERHDAEENGKLKEAKSKALQLFHAFYPNEDSTFLNDLTLDQYDSLFSAMLDHKTLDKLKSLLK